MEALSLTGPCLLWRGQSLSLREGENVLGRDDGASVVLDEPSVSRRHACITVAAGSAVLEDLGSRNGTVVRGERVHGPVVLEDRDTIRLGWACLVFRLPPRR